MSESRHLSTHIRRPADEVHAYVADPTHLPGWAAGPAGSVEHRDGRWFVRSPMGEVQVRFAPSNRCGVPDHDVTLPDADTAAMEADLATLTRLLEPGPGPVADG